MRLFLLSGIVLVLFSASASVTQAEELSQTALFSRCYSQLTGHPVPLQHPDYIKVKAGTEDALTACDALLDKAEIGSNNQVPSDNDSIAILNNFYHFHRSWFSVTDSSQIEGFDLSFHRGTNDMYDANEPALALTYNLLKSGEKYQDVLRYSTGFHALRTEDPAVVSQFKYTASFPGRRLYSATLPDYASFVANIFSFRDLTKNFSISGSGSVLLKVPGIEVGHLTGIKKQTQSFIAPNISLDNTAASRGNLQTSLNYSYDLYATFGGGIIGEPIYLMMNLGHPRNLKFNGADKLPRRWVMNSMQTFLCTNFPNLRESDITSYLVTKPTSTTPPFRQANSCLQCHAALDQAAYTARNIIMGQTDQSFLRDPDGHQAFAKTGMTMTSFKATTSSVSGWASNPVTNFHLQTPTGRLFFRSFTGTLVNTAVSGVGGLGTAMSNTSDYYQCAAKRYFQYFTGIDVPLYDRTDTANVDLNKNLSAQAIADRKFIEDLALDLKSNQSLSKMIKSILSSDYYKYTGFRSDN